VAVGVPVSVAVGVRVMVAVGVGVPVAVGIASIGVSEVRGRTGVAVRDVGSRVAVTVGVGVGVLDAGPVVLCAAVCVGDGNAPGGRSGAGTRPGSKSRAR
jgi:hypothetical protein